MDFSYEEIAKYVLDYQIDGNRIVVEFQNETGEVYDSTSVIKRSNNITNQVQKKVGRMVKSQARRHTSRMVRAALGGGMLGRIGSQVARSTVGNANLPGGGGSHSEEHIQEAIGKAFRRVAKHFNIKAANRKSTERDRRVSSRDRGEQRSVRASQRVDELDFQTQLEKYPVKNLFEQDILARIMVSIAKADGKITEDERDLITELLPKKIGSISDIASRGEISSIESEEIDTSVKRSIYLLAWSVALVDLDLSPSEIRKLNEYGALFGLDLAEIEKLSDLAKYETMSSVMDPYMSKGDLYDAASGIDLSNDEAERMLIKFKKAVTY